tara:strand:+ start:1153 stop:2868 length:1716 start_codon:yes stop_codon:yes gene_type:complete
MKQKKVKIIGLKINSQQGILQSCELAFNEKNNLIAVKGAVGAGKTTLQKSLGLGTLGSDTLKDDKSLYGAIDQEIQLLDGGESIFVGCKSTSKGGLDFVLYQKDDQGKVIKNPVIDGVKCTPATYLKNLQTALTWRMDELMSESVVVQKKLLLELYKTELASQGVVFDKKSDQYKESILGKIELAENDRLQKEFQRKTIGGFANQLDNVGIDVDNVDTHPTRVDVSESEKKKNSLSYEIENIDVVGTQKLDEIKNRAGSVVNVLKSQNNVIESDNQKLESEFEKRKEQYSQNVHTLSGVVKDITELFDQKCISDSSKNTILKMLDTGFKNEGATCQQLHPLVDFDDNGRVTSKSSEWKGSEDVLKNLIKYEEIKKEYSTMLNAPKGSTKSLETQLDVVVEMLGIAAAKNKHCDMLSAFLAWRAANDLVMSLRDEYASMLASVDTGVEGLRIAVDKEESGKLDIYLTYDGTFDPAYFNNTGKIQRKLSSYSGTQKPMICLLLQNYLLNKLPKAMRYLWIDNVPIDNKTKLLLEKMGHDLDMTVIVNITGDFTKEGLTDGEILIEGGEVFFNN